MPASSSSNPVVVIGSGPAGAAAASVLVSAGVSTMLLEYGARDARVGMTFRLRGLTLAKLRRPLVARGDVDNRGDEGLMLLEELGPGGLSNHWACAVPRFSEVDFADAARGGPEHVWPLGYQDLVPWYERVEPLLHISGSATSAPHLPAGRVETANCLDAEWQSVTAAAEKRGRSVSVMPYANGANTALRRGATAFNAYTQLLEPQIKAGRLAATYQAEATELEWSPGDNKVVAVRYRDLRTGELRRQPCSAVVVACGALRSPQLLAQSKSAAFPGGLGNQRGLVGRYFHDHPIAKLEIAVDRPRPIFPASYITRPSLERSKPLYAAALMQWCGTPALARSFARAQPGRSSVVGFTVFGTMIPSHSDRLTFEPTPDGRVQLGVELRYPPEVRQTLIECRDDALAMLEEAGWQPRLHSWFIDGPGTSVHYYGTCRMHASEQYGVVDHECRVYGTPNVVVADSSVFPTGPEKNPVLTAMALAARAAGALARSL